MAECGKALLEVDRCSRLLMTYHNAGAQAVWHRHYRSLQRAFTIYAGSSDSSSHVSKPKAALMNKAEWLRLLQVQCIVCERAHESSAMSVWLCVRVV